MDLKSPISKYLRIQKGQDVALKKLGIETEGKNSTQILREMNARLGEKKA